MLQVIIFGMDEKIKAYLDRMAELSDEFKGKYETTEKTIKGCCKYISNLVRETIQGMGHNASAGYNCGQIEDEVVYNMAVQYFMDDEIKEEKPKVVQPKETPKKEDASKKDSKPKKETNPVKEEQPKKIGKMVELSLF